MLVRMRARTKGLLVQDETFLIPHFPAANAAGTIPHAAR